MGRDLRTVAAIQQQMLKAQQEIERSYWTLRRDQDQRRELEQVASDAVLLVGGPGLRVTKYNDSAGLVLLQVDGTLCAQMLGLVTQAMQSGKAVEVRARLKSKGPESPLLDLFVTPFQGRDPGSHAKHVLVRARHVGRPEGVHADARTVITDTQGRILMASDALAAMCADPDAAGLFGKSLSAVLDNAQGALSGLLATALRDGMAHLPSAIVGGRSAPAFEVEVSATLIVEGDKERIGFSLKVRAADNAGTWAGALESIVAGRQTLAERLHEVQNLTERRVITDTLRSTGANMESSANLLGISVEDLTQRLERLGLDHARYIAH